MTSHHDELVERYLAEVARTGADLPADRREELLADLREHVETARAELPGATEADVREILSRLGDPASIVAEARLGVASPPVPAPDTPTMPDTGAWATSRPPSATPLPPTPFPPPPTPAPRRAMPAWAVALLIAAALAALICVAVPVFGLFAWTSETSGGPRVSGVQVVPVPTPSPPPQFREGDCVPDPGPGSRTDLRPVSCDAEGALRIVKAIRGAEIPEGPNGTLDNSTAEAVCDRTGYEDWFAYDAPDDTLDVFLCLAPN